MATRENTLLRSIVVGTDFSVCAARALAHAVSLARLSCRRSPRGRRR